MGEILQRRFCVRTTRVLIKCPCSNVLVSDFEQVFVNWNWEKQAEYQPSSVSNKWFSNSMSLTRSLLNFPGIEKRHKKSWALMFLMKIFEFKPAYVTKLFIGIQHAHRIYKAKTSSESAWSKANILVIRKKKDLLHWKRRQEKNVFE